MGNCARSGNKRQRLTSDRLGGERRLTAPRIAAREVKAELIAVHRPTVSLVARAGQANRRAKLWVDFRARGGQEQAVAIGFQPSGKDDAKRLIARLRRVAVAADKALADQIVAIGRDLAVRDATIRDAEAQLHELTCRLFGLTPAERRLVEAGRL